MKTISKGRFVVLKGVKTKGGTYYRYIARGSREECMLYIIDFAKDSLKLGWSTDVHLYLHVFPISVSAYFNIIKYNRNQNLLNQAYRATKTKSKSRLRNYIKQLKTKHHD